MSEPIPDSTLFDDVVNLAKRRGFVFPSAEIYGGFRSTYDYGPLGVLMLRNVKNAWWRSMVQLRDDVVGLDAAILSPPAIWGASGHLTTFSDPMVDCRNCKERHRADHIADTCPNCGSTDLTEARDFQLMFKTHAGPVQDEGSVAYLRPETAQGMFTNFMNVATTTRKKPPFGIAQVGKSFRNEITPGNFVFRTREFEQMEMEYFVPPAEAGEWFDYWVDQRFAWYQDYGIPAEMLRLRPHDADELSHYSAGTTEIEFLFPWGWGEREGVANRTEERAVLRLDWRLAPNQVAVLPLSKKPELEPTAREVLALLQPHFQCDYDVTQSIGKRYRRQDEVGTPWCITVDFDTIEDRAVTVRDRDTTEQVRVPIDGLIAELIRRTQGS